MYLFIIVPFLYFLKTRLKSKVQKVSWLFVYFVPNIFIYFYITGFDLSTKNILLMVISIVLINYIYENGYMQNDIILTKKEKNPNLRIDGEMLFNVRKNILSIFFIRFFIVVILLTTIFLLVNDFTIFLKYLLVVLLLQVLYLVYNNIRNIGNLYLILPLSYLRFYGFILPLVEFENLIEFITFTTLLYPFLKMLEFTKQPRYNLPNFSKLVGNVDIFRIKYYGVLAGITILYFFIFESTLQYFIVIVIYYLLFRIGTYLAIYKSQTVKEHISSNTKSDYRK